MTRKENLAATQHAIVTLLSYPKVGPLTAGAIRVNLGADEAEAKEALDALLAEGKVIRAGTTPVPHLGGAVAVPVGEERYTVPSTAGSERP